MTTILNINVEIYTYTHPQPLFTKEFVQRPHSATCFLVQPGFL